MPGDQQVIRGPERQTNTWTASRWLTFAVSAAIIATLAAFLLDALEEVEERAEKLMVEITWRNMRTGLQLAMGEAMMHGKDREIAGWEGSNPLRWLGREPEGYLGECTTQEAMSLAAGTWCFDRERRELAYRPRHAAHLRMVPSDGGEKVLRWRVVSVQGAGNGASTGLSVAYVTAFEWILE